MVQKKQKGSKIPNHGKFENDPHLSERIVILLFLIFTISSVIILLKGMPDSVFLTTSLASGGLTLDTLQYSGNDKLDGAFVFSLDPRDVLPSDSAFVFSIITDASKCSLKYSCSPTTSSSVNWYSINATTGACGLIEPDPEGECCLRQGDKCPQVILNKEFDDRINKWSANAGKTIINTETLTWFDENDEKISSVVMFQDAAMFSGGSYNFSLLQKFTDSRKIRMKEVKSPVTPTFCVDSDGGNVSDVFGICEGKYSDGTTSTNPDTCKTASLIKESYCENKECKDTYYTCPFGQVCQSGACTTSLPVYFNNTCSDSDGGKNPGVKGTVTMRYGDTFTSYTDVCVESAGSSMESENIFQAIFNFLRDKVTGKATFNTQSKTVKEYYCKNNAVANEVMTCPNGGICSNGACSGGNTFPAEFSEFSGASVNDVKINWSVAWQTIEDASFGCAFEIVVSSNTSRSLHYYYPLTREDMYECISPPADNLTDKYILMSVEGSDPDEEIKIWGNVSRYLIIDWKSKFSNTDNDYVDEIKIVSKKRTGVFYGVTTVFGQKIFIEYINIFKSSVVPETSCIEAGKRCCLNGTGFGTYYGQQLDCLDDYECWSSCSDTISLRLTQFMAKSDHSEKNRTSDECQAWVDGVKINGEDDGLHDYCSEEGVGKGYTLVYDNNGQPISYALDFDDITLRAPNQNGTYSLKVRYQYSPVSYPCKDNEYNDLSSCMIFEKFASFSVGSTSCISNWVNITSWGDCVGSVQWRTEEDINRCENIYIRNVSQACGCSIIWGNCAWQVCQGTNQEKLCSDTNCGTGTTNITGARTCCVEQWEPSEGDCINGAKTITYIDYNNCGTRFISIDDSIVSCTGGNNQSTSIFKQWWFWVIVIIILLGIFIMLLLSVLKKKPKSKVGRSEGARYSLKSSSPGTSSSENPEIISYINEAIASGLSKEDIKAKLIEAGWPEDVIDKSFLDAGI